MLFEKTDNTFIQLFRYFFVAAGAFVMDYGFYFLLSYIFGVQYLIAAIAGFIAGTSTNYLISKYMVFQGEPQSRSVEVFLVFLIIPVDRHLRNALSALETCNDRSSLSMELFCTQILYVLKVPQYTEGTIKIDLR